MSRDIEAVAHHLADSPYRFHNERWETQIAPGHWVESTTLDGYGYEEGVAVIAACPWARMEEPS